MATTFSEGAIQGTKYTSMKKWVMGMWTYLTLLKQIKQMMEWPQSKTGGSIWLENIWGTYSALGESHVILWSENIAFPITQNFNISNCFFTSNSVLDK